MDKIDLGTIRRASVGSIFALLSHGESLTRAQLAARGGLSLMTVGKAIDILDEASAVVQHKEDSRSTGRKSSLCSLDNRRGMIVYDFSSPIYGYSLFTVDILTDIIKNYSLADDNFNTVSAEAFMSLAQFGEVLGRGLILPDCGSEEAQNEFQQLNGVYADITETSVRTAALAASPDGESSSVYFRLNGELKALSCAFIENGRLYRGYSGTAGDLGELHEIGIYELARIVSCLIDTETVRFELPSGCDMECELSERLFGRGIKAKLEFVGYDPNRSVVGMSKLLISKWLDDICG